LALSAAMFVDIDNGMIGSSLSLVLAQPPC
jgi:hypothetical protein